MRFRHPMAKRRLSLQQKKRIEKKILLDDSLPLNDQKKGQVIARFGKQAEVLSENKIILCNIRPQLDFLACGDKVAWLLENDEGVIVGCYPRQSVLERQDRYGAKRTLAANITQMLIVIAPHPEPSWFLLDSYLLFAENTGLKVIIIRNKSDIAHPTLDIILKERYETLGYEILHTSKKLAGSYQHLKEKLYDEISILTGQSGTGKSTIINAIFEKEIDTPTSHLTENTALGRHTTSLARLYPLKEGGSLIDSPGIREFGLPPMAAKDIMNGFRELKSLQSDCAFRNCDHKQSQGCAILKALENGTISKERFEHCMKLIASQPNLSSRA